MRILRIISIIIVGTLFIFSGTVKGIDPLGSAYKFHDYFEAFGIGFLNALTVILSFILCLAEFITGFSILTGINRRAGTWGALILMIVFTPLTFILALTNPVSDCGCFGDAIHLSNWQTFFKNIILLGFVLVLFTNRKKESSSFSPLKQWIITGSASAMFLSFIAYNLVYLPVIDFLPYSVGSSIPEKMKIPEGAAVSKYETTFIYEKDGARKEFTLDNYPASDTSWKFIEQKSRLTSKGYIPPIHDFSITTVEKINITDSVLSSEKPVLLIISKKLEQAGLNRLSEAIETGKNFSTKGTISLLLTASGEDEIRKLNISIPACTTDETTLKTMIRSNPGYMLLRKGTVLAKWSWANVPGVDEMMKISNR